MKLNRRGVHRAFQRRNNSRWLGSRESTWRIDVEGSQAIGRGSYGWRDEKGWKHYWKWVRKIKGGIDGGLMEEEVCAWAWLTSSSNYQRGEEETRTSDVDG